MLNKKEALLKFKKSKLPVTANNIILNKKKTSPTRFNIKVNIPATDLENLL